MKPTDICSSGSTSTTSPARQPTNRHLTTPTHVYTVNTFAGTNTFADVKTYESWSMKKEEGKIGINGLITHGTYNPKPDTCTWMSSTPAINTCT